ncbi:MAG: hypothetical protein WCL54_05790 [Clostridia bacterium]
MIKKAFEVIKNNPVLVVMYLVYNAFVLIGMLVFLSDGIEQSKNLAVMLAQLGKMYLYFAIVGVIGLLFVSGAGAMLAEAVVKGKTSISSFFPFVKKFFGRILLSALLMIAYAIVFSIALSIIITVPIVLITLSSGLNTGGAAATTNMVSGMTTATSALTMLIVLIALPFFAHWFPSIFMDDTTVIKGMLNGFKSAKKNYGKLILIVLAIYLPTMFYTVYSLMNTTFSLGSNAVKDMMGSPVYYAQILISVVISVIVIPMLFITYYEHQLKLAAQAMGQAGQLDQSDASAPDNGGESSQ